MSTTTESMTARTEPLVKGAKRYRRHPDRHVDERGVVIGPWTHSIRRTTALMRDAGRY